MTRTFHQFIRWHHLTQLNPQCIVSPQSVQLSSSQWTTHKWIMNHAVDKSRPDGLNMCSRSRFELKMLKEQAFASWSSVGQWKSKVNVRRKKLLRGMWVARTAHSTYSPKAQFYHWMKLVIIRFENKSAAVCDFPKNWVTRDVTFLCKLLFSTRLTEHGSPQFTRKSDSFESCFDICLHLYRVPRQLWNLALFACRWAAFSVHAITLRRRLIWGKFSFDSARSRSDKWNREIWAETFRRWCAPTMIS